MSRAHIRRGIAGLLTTGIFLLAIVIFAPTPQAETGQKLPDAARKPRPEGKPIAMPVNLVGLEVRLGLTDENPTPWDGEVQVSAGRLLDLNVARGGPKAKVTGASYTARSVRQMAMMKQVVGPILHLNLDAPPNAIVTLKTEQGKVEFKLADLTAGTTKKYLDGRASIERQEAAVRLTGRETEDDFPRLAKGADGTVWLAYVEYAPGPPLVKARVHAGISRRSSPPGNGDRVRLLRVRRQDAGRRRWT